RPVNARAFLPLGNGGSAPLADVPCLQPAPFREAVVTTPAARLVSLFGFPDEDAVRVVAILERPEDRNLLVTSMRAGEAFPALTPDMPQAHLFEREIAETWGLVPEGHPWLKPVRFVRPRRAPSGAATAVLGAPGVMGYFTVAGEEVHEVAVGPVHAGVIEPGHFRFQCHGERVIHLEISLGYQYRGIERAMEGGPDIRTVHRVDAVAGDMSAGHAAAYAQVVEALTDTPVPPRGAALRAIALELERMANHAGDLGALSGDIGYLPAAAFCGRIRGDLLNLTLAACGNRMGVGWIRPGGAAADFSNDAAHAMADAVDRAVAELGRSFLLILKNSTARSRLEETGVLPRETCVELGMVGPAARASGVAVDVRKDHPLGAYASAPVVVAVRDSGDVFARAAVRSLECAHSAEYLAKLLRSLPAGPARGGLPAGAGANRIAVSLVEAWRGEICHAAVTDDQGRFRRYAIVDPSFHNWPGLAMAMRDQPVSDFPLCNKSFNLSYSGYDR
ncbi:MAG TPA: NADH-quinone oxidoreductase subunit C, partial [Candidatus Omnitrophota bacterium]|nr:NADH-quinone oxidoreductase subunit C [Candidatus Omnitrophota bacterium]